MNPNSSLKKVISISIDPMVHRYVRTKPNYSRYIEGLIKQDMQLQNKEAIYEAITERMLKDDAYLARLAQRLNKSGPVVEQVDKGVTVVQGEWGA